MPPIPPVSLLGMLERLSDTRFTVGHAREALKPPLTTRFTVGLAERPPCTTRFTVGLASQDPRVKEV